MNVVDWLKEHLIGPLMPDVPDVSIDNDLYDWIEREHRQLKRQIESERDIIQRRARKHNDGEHEEHGNGLA